MSEELTALSSNHLSVDDQTTDALRYLKTFRPSLFRKFLQEYPEWPNLIWDNSWVDAEASNVDPDYMSWLRDWLEANTPIQWLDGEPYWDAELEEGLSNGL